MLSKVIRIFRKDVKIATRDTMLIYIIFIPILLAVGILLFAPGITDRATTVAMLSSDSQEYIDYIETYAQVELFSNMDELERRVLKRDDVAGIVTDGDSYQVIVEGNEGPQTGGMAEMLNAFYELGATRENTTAELVSFEKTVPPLSGKSGFL